MKFRTTLILLVVCGALFAYLYFYEAKQPGAKEAASQRERFVDLDRDNINAVSIQNAETKIELHKKDAETWMMDEPVKDRADSSAINQLFTSVETLHHSAAIDPDAKDVDKKMVVKESGVDNAKVKVKFSGDKVKPVEIAFGRDAAVENQIYARVEGEKTIYVIPADLRNQVSKKADDFRDHRLTDLTATQVTKAQIKTAAGEIELQKDREHWQLNKPIKARGDDAKIGDLVANTLNTQVTSFVSGDETAAATTAISDPRGTVTFTAEGNDKPVVLEISKPNEKGNVYAKLSTRDSILIVPAKAGDLLDIKPNDVRDKHLTRLNLDTVDRIHVEPAGKPKITLARKGENWTIQTSGDKPANSAEVRQLAETLQNQQVTNFVSDVATELPKYGLDQPQLKVTFSAYASSNTAETKAGENPITTILFGKTEGENVYAKLDEEPFIVSVPVTMLSGIFTDPLQWQDLAIYQLKPEDIATLEIAREGQPPLALMRDKETWKPAKGDAAINNTNVQSLANTLASLHAARWVGAAKPEQGLDKPEITVSFATADKKSNKLRVGAPTPDGFFFAAAEGREGTFAISKPDHDALALALTQSAAQPSPGANASPDASAATSPVSVTTEPVTAPMPAASVTP